jgi:hypothetical protein
MIAASVGSREVAQELTSRLDLPDTAPIGVTWSPFVTGFPFGEWYVVARTIADEQASRAGMVFSHALLAPIDHISKFSNLRQICSHLLTAPVSTETLAPIEVDPAAPNAQGLDEEAVETVNLLISSSKNPVVRLGTDGFEDLICNLWPKFWPELRRNFTFRLSFGPNDLVEAPLPLLVCTPANLAARWSHFPLIAPNGTSDRSSPAADLLIEDGQQTVGLQPLIKALGIRITTFPELALLNRLHDLYSAGTLNLDTDVAKVRLIDALSRGEKRHAIGRDDLIEEVAKQILAATPQQISELTLMEDPQFRQLAHFLNTTRLSVAQATDLGQLINIRRWGQSAQSFVHLARQGREDIKAVLRECQGLLGFWDRLKLGLNIFNADEKWNSFADLGADLYSEGPREREVWQRAGGKNADLITHGDGRTRWYDAVYKIRRGNRLRSWELLDKMREDFSWNEDLRALSSDPEFRRHGGA